MPFFGSLLKKLTPPNNSSEAGQVIFATNEKWYFDELREMGPQLWNLKIYDEKEISMAQNESFKARTHFEKKYLERGQTCYELIFQKDV